MHTCLLSRPAATAVRFRWADSAMVKPQFITAAMLALSLAIQAPAQDKASPTQERAIAAIKKMGGSVRVDPK
ncbi:MAG: hypothetical protein IH991_19340, partial [Planctomycetes bacterium]|nr:hypothetical protein [Planctomycetota bacterium]